MNGTLPVEQTDLAPEDSPEVPSSQKGITAAEKTRKTVLRVVLVLFFVVHVLMVVYAGPVNHLRSMLTGRFRVRWPRGEAGDG